MTIKFSNAVLETVPQNLLQECILLSYSVVPRLGVHAFHLECSCEKSHIVHAIAGQKYECEAFIGSTSSTDIVTDIVIYQCRQSMYVLLRNEFEACLLP